MDGKDLLRRLRELLDEESTGTWLDDRTSYDYMWEAAKEFVRRTGFRTDVQRIETQEDVSGYTLDGTFMGLYQMDDSQRYFIKFIEAGSETKLFFKDYEEIEYNDSQTVVDIKQGTISYLQSDTQFRDTGQDFTDYDVALNSSSDLAYQIRIYNDDGTVVRAYLGDCPDTSASSDYINLYDARDLKTRGVASGTVGTPSYYTIEKVSSQSTPSCFSIRPKESLASQVTGTCTKDKTATNGECLLVDSSAKFYTTDYVSEGDHIHNTSDGSTGVVLEVVSNTQLYVALFGGTDNSCGTTDAYVIQPAGKMELVLDPAPNADNYLIELPYVREPHPVYSDYRTYNFPHQVLSVIIKYAAWLYKYRDSDPDFGDALYVLFDRAVRQIHKSLQPTLKRRKFRVNLKRRASSWRA